MKFGVSPKWNLSPKFCREAWRSLITPTLREVKRMLLNFSRRTHISKKKKRCLLRKI
jgi:hypothetical protein